MKTSEVQFHFPVLGWTPDKDIWAFPDLNTLTSCGPKTLKEDMQANMELVDIELRRWIVRSVHRKGRGKPFALWLISHVISTPQSRIEHELEPMPPVTLDEVKARVCEAMEENPGYYGDSDTVDEELRNQMAEVRAAGGVAEIIELLGLDSFMAY
ncbi:MAG TPA: hypothetical protein VFN88_03345 [Caulobacteraceae bacterium]|nr:hypothetical protein [Caulobacteraceae bacterium]